MAKHLLYTTDAEKAGYTFEEYKNYLIESGKVCYEELPVRKDEDFYEWAEMRVYQDYHDFESNIVYGSYNTACYVTGSVGQWDGRHEIAKTPCDTLLQAIRKCIKSQDDFEIYADGNAVYVDSFNHDSQYHGGNHFKIVIRGKKIKGGRLY